MQFYEVTHHERTTSSEAFGVSDERGRELGVRVAVWTEKWTVDSDTTRTFGYPVSSPGLSEGTKFCAHVQMTRAGKSYGAHQPYMRFTLAQDRDGFVAKRIAYSRKQAVKKYT